MAREPGALEEVAPAGARVWFANEFTAGAAWRGEDGVFRRYLNGDLAPDMYPDDFWDHARAVGTHFVVAVDGPAGQEVGGVAVPAPTPVGHDPVAAPRPETGTPGGPVTGTAPAGGDRTHWSSDFHSYQWLVQNPPRGPRPVRVNI